MERRNLEERVTALEAEVAELRRRLRANGYGPYGRHYAAALREIAARDSGAPPDRPGC